MKKVALLFIFLFVFIPSVSAFAQNTQGLTVVAEVDIQNAQIVDQVGNVLAISFGLLNGAGAQGDIHYGVRLVKNTKDGSSVVSEYFYDEVLTLLANSSTQKDIIYNAPEVLSGEYQVQLFAQNSEGFPFGTASLGQVSLTATKRGAVIDNCLVVSTTRLTPVPANQGTMVKNGDFFRMKCSVENTSADPVTIKPSFVTHSQSSVGPVENDVKEDAGEYILNAGEKKDILWNLPIAKTMGRHVVVFAGTEMQSMAIPYIYEGFPVNISNISTDMDYYAKGSQAMVRVLWNGQDAKSVDVEVRNANGSLCGSTETMDVTGGKADIAVQINKNCRNPQIGAVLKDASGAVLDQKSVEFKSSKAPFPIKAVLLGALVLLVIGLYFMFRKKSAPAVIAMGILFLLLPTDTIQAKTFTAGPNGNEFTIDVSVDKLIPATYGWSDAVTISGTITSNTATNYNTQITAKNEIGLASSAISLYQILYNKQEVIIAGGSTLIITGEHTSPSIDGQYDMRYSFYVEKDPRANPPSGNGLIVLDLDDTMAQAEFGSSNCYAKLNFSYSGTSVGSGSTFVDSVGGTQRPYRCNPAPVAYTFGYIEVPYGNYTITNHSSYCFAQTGANGTGNVSSGYYTPTGTSFTLSSANSPKYFTSHCY